MTPAPAQFIVQLAGNIIQSLELTMETLTIGRTPDNELALPHPLVSRRHAELHIGPNGVLLTDLGSVNGTFVGSTRLLAHQPQILEDGALVQIGPFVLAYCSAAVLPHEDQIESPASITAPDSRQLPALPGATQLAAPAPSAPIARLPMPTAQGTASRYLYDLPIIYHDSDFLGRYLMIFESLWEPLEQRQDHIDMYFDPRTCPASFLPWLAGWLGLSLNPRWPEKENRRLVTEAMDLYRWRGTRYGLTRMIEIRTGLMPEIIEDPSQPLVFRIRLAIPPDSGIEHSLIEDLVRTHKPAHVGYILELQP